MPPKSNKGKSKSKSAAAANDGGSGSDNDGSPSHSLRKRSSRPPSATIQLRQSAGSRKKQSSSSSNTPSTLLSSTTSSTTNKKGKSHSSKKKSDADDEIPAPSTTSGDANNANGANNVNDGANNVKGNANKADERRSKLIPDIGTLPSLDSLAAAAARKSTYVLNSDETNSIYNDITANPGRIVGYEKAMTQSPDDQKAI